MKWVTSSMASTLRVRTWTDVGGKPDPIVVIDCWTFADSLRTVGGSRPRSRRDRACHAVAGGSLSKILSTYFSHCNGENPGSAAIDGFVQPGFNLPSLDVDGPEVSSHMNSQTHQKEKKMLRLTKKKFVLGAATVCVLAIAAGAYAYFISTGSGTATATVGSSSTVTLTARSGQPRPAPRRPSPSPSTILPPANSRRDDLADENRTGRESLHLRDHLGEEAPKPSTWPRSRSTPSTDRATPRP